MSRVPAREGGVAAAAASYGGGHRARDRGRWIESVFGRVPPIPPRTLAHGFAGTVVTCAGTGGGGRCRERGAGGDAYAAIGRGSATSHPPPLPPPPTPPLSLSYLRPQQLVFRLQLGQPSGCGVRHLGGWQVCDCFLFDKGPCHGCALAAPCVRDKGGGWRRARGEARAAGAGDQNKRQAGGLFFFFFLRCPHPPPSPTQNKGPKPRRHTRTNTASFHTAPPNAFTTPSHTPPSAAA